MVLSIALMALEKPHQVYTLQENIPIQHLDNEKYRQG